ncbi:MAG: hypothetical protein JSV53_02110 [candidate division WOR-3 bacterium]|nr:MAG: hypothetical protein JSV53_02110 [candidate division WOR-3 bacterium]
MDKISAVLNQQRSIAVFPMVCADHGAHLLRLEFKEVAQNGKKLARVLQRCYELYGYDMVLVFSDPYVEAQSMGCPVKLNPYPTLLGPASNNSIDRTQEIIRAAEILKDKLDVPIFVSVKGPFTLAAFLGGIERFLKMILKNENEASQLLRDAQQNQLEYLERILSVGVNIMIGDPLASSSVISPAVFAKHALVGIKSIIEKSKAHGVLAGIHICGDVSPILKHLDTSGADILSVENIDVQTDTVRMGGVGTDTILNGDIRRIRSEVENALRQKPIILSTSCDVPAQTNPENIKTMLRIASECGNELRGI